MKQLWIVISWEFFRHFKSKSFLLATFVSPVLLALILMIPTLVLDRNESQRPYVIGLVSFDTTSLQFELRERFLRYRLNSPEPSNIELINISADTTDLLRRQFQKEQKLKSVLDSLNEEYLRIKEQRKYIFQKPKTRSRENLLKQTYEKLIATREARDLAQLDYEDIKAKNDSLWQQAVINYADSLLIAQVLDGYFLIDEESFEAGDVEFHSYLPASFLKIEPVKQLLQELLIEKRMRMAGVRVDRINEWLQPIKLKEIQIQGELRQEFDFVINYLGPIVVVLFLFISIFTSSGFLFNGILKEKSNRVIEILLSSVSHGRLILGKILGLGFLGILQIIIWISVTVLLVFLGTLPLEEIGFLTLQNALLFIIYFILGYLFFASLFVGIGSLFSAEEDAHHLNQFMRLLSIFPIVMALLVIETPNSLLVRILSFIPPLTPTFMILRTPLGNPPPVDYYISIGILLLTTVLFMFLAGRIFRMGSLLYGTKPSLKKMLELILKAE
ncbi:MAG: hypothetical protein Kow0037_17940 [Calditrichia bacterium]